MEIVIEQLERSDQHENEEQKEEAREEAKIEESEDDSSIEFPSELDQDDEVHTPFVAPVQPNTIKRSIVRLGLTQQELV